MLIQHHITYIELCEAMRLDALQCSALSFFYSSRFRTKWSRLQVQRHKGEEYLAFWGFVSSAHIQNKLLALISYVFKTRMIIAANTKQGMFECVCAIENTTTSALRAQYEHCCRTSTPASTEEFLLWFLQLFNMSADVIHFDRILDPQMLASIDRLEHARSPLYGNLTSPALSDFYELYKWKSALRDDHATAHVLTGLDLSVDSLYRLHLRCLRAEARNKKLASDLLKMQDSWASDLHKMQELCNTRERELHALRSARNIEMQELAKSKSRLVIAARLISSAIPSVSNIDARTDMEGAYACADIEGALGVLARNKIAAGNIDARHEAERASGPPQVLAAASRPTQPEEGSEDSPMGPEDSPVEELVCV